MSGGQPAIRGYLVQTLIGVLDSLDSDRPWERVTLEPPDKKNEKIDLLWDLQGRTRAVQVKSSQNLISLPNAKRWAKELATHHGGADELELVLVGHCAQSVLAMEPHCGVIVPRPKALDLEGLILEAAQRLARFLESRGEWAGRADQREQLVRDLAWQLVMGSAEGQTFERDELEKYLVQWSCKLAAESRQFPIFAAPAQNPYFTGRVSELELLRTRLKTAGTAPVGQAISGLGGIGKTQTAIAYAHHYRDEYETVFWINSAAPLELKTDYANIATLLGLPHDRADPEAGIRAALRWLSAADGPSWLLIFDNADESEILELIKDHLPRGSTRGHVLVTSRARALAVLGVVSPLQMEPLPKDDATKFLLKRTERTAAGECEVEAASALATELDGLPLALEQAAGYVVAMKVTIGQYLERYRKREGKLQLLEKHGPEIGDYPRTVATTWQLNMEQVVADSPAAAELLRLTAFLGARDIPFELLLAGRGELGETLTAAIDPAEPLSVNELLEPLSRFSLVTIDSEARTYSVHRLVQEVTKATLDESTRRSWAVRVVRALNAAFPDPIFSNWPTCERLSSHALIGSQLVKDCGLNCTSAARMLHSVALYLKDRGQPFAAEPRYRQSLEIFRNTLGDRHPSVATSLNCLGLLYMATGQYTDAESLFKQALDIRRAVLGEQHRDFGNSLNSLALLYESMGRLADAEKMYQQALQIFREVLGEQHPDYAAVLGNLARAYRLTGRFENAETLSWKALQILRHVYGESHPDCANSLNNLACLYSAIGRYEEAEPLCKQALDIIHGEVGERHPDCAKSLNNLGELYRKMGRFHEAKPLFEQALEICGQVFGEQHPEFARSLSNLAGLYTSKGRYVDAEPLYQQAVSIYRELHGVWHPNYANGLNNLAVHYKVCGRFEAAEPLFRQTLEISRHLFGEQHADFARSLNNLASVYESTGRHKDAEPLYQQALAIYRNVYGERHPDFATSLSNLARLYRSTGRYGDAEPLYLQALDIRREALGEQHPHFAQILDNLASLYRSTGRHHDAELLYQQALQIRRRVLGEQHPDFAQSLNNLAMLYVSTGRFDKAEQMFRQALAVVRIALGREHPDTKIVEANFKRFRRQLESRSD